MQILEMLSAHPDVVGTPSPFLLECIEQCYGCAQSCTTCANACVAEPDVAELRQCIRLNLDCADICIATGSMASRRTGSNVDVLSRVIAACEVACRKCAIECHKHQHHEHCRICAHVCDLCADACRAALTEVH